MYDITVYPNTISPWFSQVYAGLFDLQRSNKAKVSISTLFEDGRLIDGTSLAMDVHEPKTGNKIKILIDLNDNRNIAVPQVLETFDVIVKRGFYRPYIDNLDEHLQRKIIPYGVNYNCGSSSVPILQLFTYHHLMRLRLLGESHSKVHKLSIQHQLRFLFFTYKNNLSLHETDFIGNPDSPTKHKVFFITRLFISDKGLSEFSAQRIELVRALKKEFGSRFYGGIVRTQSTEKYCPRDLLLPKVSRRKFTSLLKESDIAINTLGVGQSNPWKLGESIAAARCIVSEPLLFDLPEPLQENVNLKTFNSIDECLSACNELMNSPEQIRWIKENNKKYYQENIRAEILLNGLLRRSWAAHVNVIPKVVTID